jgi:maleate isomerase
VSARLSFETDGGAGERAAFGLIVLQSDETMEMEFRPLFDRAGAALYHSRIPSAPEVSAETLAQMEAEMPRAASLLPTSRGLNAVGYGCTSGATIIGPENVAAAVRRHHPDAQVTDPITAVMAALRHLNCSRVAFLTPYVAEVSSAMRNLLERNGFSIAAFGSFEQSNEATVARVTEQSLLEAIVQLGAHADADCVFASCTNLRSFNVIAEAEAQLGKPVISSNLAFAWHLLMLGGSDVKGLGPGRLFN